MKAAPVIAHPAAARPLAIAYGGAGNLARIERAESISWDDLVARLTATPPTNEDKAAADWFIPAEFRGTHRDADNLIARHALSLDYDTITPADVAAIERALAPFEFVIYTTASHTQDKPRLRVVLPLSRPASADEFRAVSRHIAALAGIELAARESHVPTQMTFNPTVRPGGIFRAKRHRGQWVDVDTVLATYADWTDRTSWPRRAEHDDTRKPEPGTDPRQKTGIVGDFCQAFTVPEAIEAFELPYKHEHGNRWTYLKGSRAEGAVVYQDLHLHSHHDTDPARGQCNAFDLVRKHLYGHLDEGIVETDVTRLPSYRAMVAEAAQRHEVQAARVAEFDVLPALSPEAQAEADEIRARNPAARKAEREAEAKQDAAEAQTGEPLGRCLGELWRNPTKPEWLLKDRLEAGIIGVLAGVRGSYKSFLALDWSMKIAAGEDPQPVYVISAEGGDFDRRARAWQQHHAPDAADTLARLVRVVERRLDLNTADGIKAVLADIKAWGETPALIVLDTFSKLSGGLDENDNTEVKQFIGRLDKAFKRQGITVLIVAHTGHTEKGRPRGASAFGADTDAEYIVQRRPGASEISVSRERFKSSPELPPLHLKADIVDLGYQDERGEPVTSIVLRKAEPTRTSASKGPSGAKQKAVYELVPEFGTALISDVIAGALPSVPHDPDDPKEVRQARSNLRRAVTTLTDNEVLFVVDNRLSRTRVVEAVDDAEIVAKGAKAELQGTMRFKKQ